MGFFFLNLFNNHAVGNHTIGNHVRRGPSVVIVLIQNLGFIVTNKSSSALIRSIIYRIFSIELAFLLPESVEHLAVGIELLD